MSWQALEELINITIQKITNIAPHFDGGVVPIVNPDIPKAVYPLMDAFGSCIGKAKARFPENIDELEKIEGDVRSQLELLYGVKRRTLVNYLSILNLGIQKISEAKEYIKTLEYMQIRDIDESIPEEVRDDFKEACMCYANGCYNASAVMCRRAIETVTIIEDADARTLHAGIEELADKGLDTSLIELAHEIRLLGNVPAAHRDRVNLIRNVTPEECEYLLDFLEAFLDSMYVRPNQIERLREGRTRR